MKKNIKKKHHMIDMFFSKIKVFLPQNHAKVWGFFQDMGIEPGDEDMTSDDEWNP